MGDETGINVRDLAEVEAGMVRSGLIFRASMAFTEKDLESMNIKTVIDLRRQTAQINWTKEDVNLFHIPLVNSAVKNAMLFSLPTAKLMTLLMSCFTNAEEVFIDHIMSNAESLSAFYTILLETGLVPIKQVFDILAKEESYPIMVHCVAGKDRTGLIVMLVLSLCGVDDAHIIDDYVSSEANLRAGKERLVALHESLLDDRALLSPPEALRRTMQNVVQRYGSIEDYLKEKVGIPEEQLDQIQTILAKQTV